MDAETDASYESAGFGKASSWGERPAVLVVDMCRAYFEEGSPLNLDQPSVIDATKELVTAARAAAVPVVWTRVEYEPGGSNGGVWYSKVPVLSSFDRGNPLADWIEDLHPTANELVVTKQHASGFAGTDLADQLRKLPVDSLVICGVSTSGCVRATATDASAESFMPFVVAEAVGDRTVAVQRANLFDLNAKYADVVSAASTLDYFASLALR